MALNVYTNKQKESKENAPERPYSGKRATFWVRDVYVTRQFEQ